MAAATKKKRRSLYTPKFRISFPHLFRPNAAFQGQDAKYSVTMLFPKGADLSKLEAAANAKVKERWPNKVPKKFNWPFKEQADKAEYEGYEDGAIYIAATSKQKPGIVDGNVDAVLDENEVYAGRWAIATVNPYTYDVQGNAGVSFGLNNIQLKEDAESLGGRPPADQEFDEDDDDDEAPF